MNNRGRRLARSRAHRSARALSAVFAGLNPDDPVAFPDIRDLGSSRFAGSSPDALAGHPLLPHKRAVGQRLLYLLRRGRRPFQHLVRYGLLSDVVRRPNAMSYNEIRRLFAGESDGVLHLIVCHLRRHLGERRAKDDWTDHPVGLLAGNARVVVVLLVG